MRAETNAAKVWRLMQELGERSKGPGKVYLTGGATAVLEGWRDTTVDVDLKLDPEPAGALEAIRLLKDELDINVELAAPDQFIPPLPGWRERSRYVGSWGNVDFYHYDAHAQALSKIERGHARDLVDAREMVARGLVSAEQLLSAFAAIRSELERYPAIDERAFEAKLGAFVKATQKP
jgi:Nucleotidyltransferase of unknown function (DUF6036)